MPFQLFAEGEGSPSSVTFETLSPLSAEATSASGASVAFSLPVATEYNQGLNTSGSATVTCDKTSGDTFSLGATIVTCTGVGVMDSSITAQAPFTINVVDTTAPVVTLLGSSSMSVALSGTFSDPGATAIDAVHGDLTSSIVASGTVDTATLGTYTILYEAQDVSGNTGTASRTIIVADASSTPQSFTLFASAGANGTISPLGTTTASSGSNQTFTITPDFGYDVDAVTVDGSTTVATSSYEFLNITTDHTISVTFQITSTSTPDVTPPTGPNILESSSHTVNASSTSRDITLSWDSASDEVELSGYSYGFDANATSTPDTTVDTASNGITETLSPGTWYFHLRAVDSSGNGGIALHFGPLLIDDDGSTTTPDTTPPTGLTTVTSGTHPLGATSTLSSVVMVWNDASDSQSPFGYSFEFDHSSSTVPDVLNDSSATSTVQVLQNGEWYFHVRAVDSAANGGDTIHYGPFIIDADITAPVLTLNGSSTVTVYQGNAYTEAGATALDDRDGNLTSSVIVTGTPNTSVLGTSTVTYSVSDAAGNTRTASRVVTVLLPPDTTAPTLPVVTFTKTASSTLTLSFTATDATGVTEYRYALSQGSSTSPITSVGTSTSVTLSVSEGIWYGSVIALDAAGNQSAIGTSTGTLIDTTAPPLTLNGSSTVSAYQGRIYLDLGATAFDSQDGDLSGLIVTSGVVSTSTLGSYAITYSVNDASGNSASSTRIVNVIPLVYYQIDTNIVGGKGRVSSSSAQVAIDDNYTVTFTPNHGYQVASTSLDGVAQGTSTALTVTNVQSAHTINVTFAPLLTRNTYTINVTHAGRGSTSPVATSNILEGEDTDVIFTPAYLHDISSLVVNGQSVATSSVYRITNASTSYALAATFAPTIVDVTPPSTVMTTPSLLSDVIQNTDTLQFSWASSTDNLAGVEGYSYVLDTNEATVPDDMVDTGGNSVTETRGYGTYYFHIKALDYLGNASTVTHKGPFLLSNSRVYVKESSIGTTTIVIGSPTLLQASSLGLTGSTTVMTSTLINGSSATDASIINSSVGSSAVIQSSLASSTVISSAVSLSALTQSTVSSSTLNDSLLSNSTISSSSFRHARGNGAVIVNNRVSAGTFFMPDGSTYVVTEPLPVSDVVNDDPAPEIKPYISKDYIVGFDININDLDSREGVFIDGWTETLDFGDGTPVVISTTSKVTSQPIHTYRGPGDYLIKYTVRDKFGSVGEVERMFNLPDPNAYIIFRGGGGGEGGGGGGGSGGGWNSSQTLTDVTPKPLLKALPILQNEERNTTIENQKVNESKAKSPTKKEEGKAKPKKTTKTIAKISNSDSSSVVSKVSSPEPEVVSKEEVSNSFVHKFRVVLLRFFGKE